MTRISDDVAWVLANGPDGPHCLVARVPDHQPLQLSGTAIDLWLSWADGRSLEESIQEMSALYEVSKADIRPESERLFRKLEAGGYLSE
ncbi:hypothetical protein AB0Y14_09360 [Rothia sp. HC945]|uniref:hypothetical protein n=1 Tax=Rothia sp. HC945 TaxID=3171170 RepID=UPI00264B1238|nr:hypothetical protein [Kocuria sp.]MDN5655147.1 hypothetical protein [Kocuria sp.]